MDDTEGWGDAIHEVCVWISGGGWEGYQLQLSYLADRDRPWTGCHLHITLVGCQTLPDIVHLLPQLVLISLGSALRSISYVRSPTPELLHTPLAGLHDTGPRRAPDLAF